MRRRLRTELIYRGRIISLELANVELPNGRQGTFEIVGHPGGAAVVALDGEGRVCLLRHYRPVFDDWLWELPAGKLDAGEDPQAAALRELAEEAGLKAAQCESLGRAHPSPGVFGEVLHLFLARGLSPVTATPEAHELFELHWVALDEALAWAAEGKITDAKTVIGLFRARARLAVRD